MPLPFAGDENEAPASWFAGLGGGSGLGGNTAGRRIRAPSIGLVNRILETVDSKTCQRLGVFRSGRVVNPT